MASKDASTASHNFGIIITELLKNKFPQIPFTLEAISSKHGNGYHSKHIITFHGNKRRGRFPLTVYHYGTHHRIYTDNGQLVFPYEESKDVLIDYILGEIRREFECKELPKFDFKNFSPDFFLSMFINIPKGGTMPALTETQQKLQEIQNLLSNKLSKLNVLKEKTEALKRYKFKADHAKELGNQQLNAISIMPDSTAYLYLPTEPIGEKILFNVILIHEQEIRSLEQEIKDLETKVKLPTV